MSLVSPALNLHPEFDQILTERLGHYVYILIDPQDRKPFYVGKGGGKSHTGNQRVLDHFDEARQTDPDHATRGRKIARIHEIWARGKEVEWAIVRHGLESEIAAFEVECALMDALLMTGAPLTNETGGHGRSERGLVFGRDIYAHAAPAFDISAVPDDLTGSLIYLFPIHNQAIKLLKEGVSGEDRFRQATQGYWSISPKYRQSPILAIGITGGVSRGVYWARHWNKGPEKEKNVALWGFDPVTPDPAVLKAFLHKNFKAVLAQASYGYWQRGNPIAFRIKTDRTLEIVIGIDSRTAPTIGSLFQPEPTGYGLRGDPGLWRELEAKLSADPLPRSRKKLRDILCGAYRESTSQTIDDMTDIVIERFDKGGMSGGVNGGAKLCHGAAQNWASFGSGVTGRRQRRPVIRAPHVAGG